MILNFVIKFQNVHKLKLMIESWFSYLKYYVGQYRQKIILLIFNKLKKVNKKIKKS